MSTTTAARTDRIELRTTSEERARWYRRFDATPLLDDPMKLALPLDVTAAALAAPAARR